MVEEGFLVGGDEGEGGWEEDFEELSDGVLGKRLRERRRRRRRKIEIDTEKEIERE